MTPRVKWSEVVLNALGLILAAAWFGAAWFHCAATWVDWTS